MPLAEQGIDEQIAADWASIREKHSTEPETPEAVIEEVSEKPPEAEKPRDITGKFVKADAAKPAEKPETDVKPIEAKPQATPAVEPVKAEPVENASQRDINRPPSTWKPTARAE